MRDKSGLWERGGRGRMNIYLIGMIISMVVFAVIGAVISRKIRNAEDFYVAGRNAPVILIAGSLIASYSSTGMFMGDAAQCYDGAFSSIILFAGMQSAGYILGAVFFGRYLRRSKALTIPEFFGQRFDSKKMRALSAATAMVTMAVYLLSVMQGVGTLMNAVTGVDYRICIAVCIVVFTLISVMSGSRGVLITDTLMAAVFTVALIIGVLFIAKNSGGWYGALEQVAASPDTTQVLSWSGKPGVLYDTGWENIVWGLNFGVVWMSVCMVGPWQSSRYQMARDEHTIIRSSYWAAIGVFALEFLAGIGAVMVRVSVPEMEDSSHVLLWASMNLMPKLLGVLLLTGILAAGISSATTFTSLIGASVANDIFGASESESDEEDKRYIKIGQWAMILVAVVILLISIFNPPAIFVIMFLGGAVIASSWMPVAVACVFCKRLTKTGAFWGMLIGFLSCFVMKLIVGLGGFSLPAYLDSSIVGIVANIIAMVIGSALTQVTEEEKQARAAMFVMPEREKDPAEVKRTFASTRLALLIGPLFVVGMAAAWIIPYLRGTGAL